MPSSSHIDFVRSQAQALGSEVEQLFQRLWETPELPGMERLSSTVLTGFLEKHGFTIERAPGGIPTAFVATRHLGKGPRIAILAEYDALPGLANDAVPHRSPRRDPAGHACGHNHIGPANSGAGIIAASCAATLGLSGEVSIIGCPAEEILWGKLALLQQGVFEGYDAILTSHGDYQNGAISRPCQAVMSGELLLSGEAGHGGRVGGRNALEAGELAIERASQLRTEMFPDVILRHVLRNAGTMPTITPDCVRIWITARHASLERAKSLYDATRGLVERIAVDSQLGFAHLPIAGTRGYLANDALARLLLECLEAVGLPEWREEEMGWMRSLAAAVRPGETLALDRTLRLYDEGVDPYGQDDGEVSWRIPLGRINWAYPEQVLIHHWSWTAWSGHPASGRGPLMAMQALALATLELMRDRSILDRARMELGQRTAGMYIDPPVVGAWRTMTQSPEEFWNATWID